MSSILDGVRDLLTDPGTAQDIQTTIAVMIWNTYFLFAITFFFLAPVIFVIGIIFAFISVFGLILGTTILAGGLLVTVLLVRFGTRLND